MKENNIEVSPVIKTGAVEPPVVKYDPEFAKKEDKSVLASKETEVLTPIRGYKSYEQWVEEGRDLEEFKGVKAFIKDKELFDEISRSHKEQKETKETLLNFIEHSKK